MQQSISPKSSHRITIRIGRGTLSFAMPNAEGEIDFVPYTVKSGISMAANLREAFKTSDFLVNAPTKARVFIDSDVLMMPIDKFDEQQMRDFYIHSFPDKEAELVFHQVLPDLDAVAISSINKDLKLVLDDHFLEVRLLSAVSPVWYHLHQRNFTGNHLKLFGYFHERHLEVFAFQNNRFKFCNTFDIRHHNDAVFFLLYVWKQLRYNPLTDELHLVGNIFQDTSSTIVEEREALLNELHRFLQKVYVINPSADFNRAQVTELKNMPYDLQTFFVKGK
jgi:hypothetical protein